MVLSRNSDGITPDHQLGITRFTDQTTPEGYKFLNGAICRIQTSNGIFEVRKDNPQRVRITATGNIGSVSQITDHEGGMSADQGIIGVIEDEDEYPKYFKPNELEILHQTGEEDTRRYIRGSTGKFNERLNTSSQ